MGAAHVKAIEGNPAYKLVAVCDANPDAFKEMPADVPRYADAADMLKEHQLDLATLVLPNFLYEPTVKIAAERGVNLLCEKPLGHNLASCRRMVEITRANGVRGWVSAQRKYLPQFLAAREKLASFTIDFVSVTFTYYWPPAFGAMGWRGDRQKSGGIALIDTGWHAFDALYWLLGDPETVFTQISPSRSSPDIDEKAAVQLRYPSGTLANMTLSYTTPKNTFEFIFTDRDKAVVVTYDAMEYFEGGQLKDMVKPKEGADVMSAMYGTLLQAIREPESKFYITTFEQAESIMKVIDVCHRSAAAGKVVGLEG
jgi:predicted dehydrogenase